MSGCHSTLARRPLHRMTPHPRTWQMFRRSERLYMSRHRRKLPYLGMLDPSRTLCQGTSAVARRSTCLCMLNNQNMCSTCHRLRMLHMSLNCNRCCLAGRSKHNMLHFQHRSPNPDRWGSSMWETVRKCWHQGMMVLHRRSLNRHMREYPRTLARHCTWPYRCTSLYRQM